MSDRKERRVAVRCTDLCVPRVGVKDVAEEFACDGDAGDDQTMDVVRVDNECFARGLAAEFGHAVKIDEEREKDLVRRRTVFKDPEEVGFEGDRGDVTGVERERGGWREDGCAGGGGERPPYGWVVHVWIAGGRWRGRVGGGIGVGG